MPDNVELERFVIGDGNIGPCRRVGLYHKKYGRGREQKTDAGNRQIRDFQMTESVDNGFSKELVKLRENRGKEIIRGWDGGGRRVVKKDQNVRAPHGVVYDNDSTMTRRGRVSNDGEVRKLLEPRKV
ncbi:hypothetical protein EDB89DRAFT_1906901 [Lactarius sanguifluus]|nr:hypothetical protein EDB89DRAFT_1906901 [Lactarius sanguifluus]